MQFKTISNLEFVELKTEIEEFPRLCGYYIIDLVAIPGYPDDDVAREILLEDLFQHFDDQEWPSPSERHTDQAWDDFECQRDVATDHVIEALIGGRQIGHTTDTIPRAKAMELWLRFENLVSEPRHYYIGMGFGDHEHVYLYGVAIVGSDAAGLLWIVESD